MSAIILRDAVPQDAAAIQAIYSHHVLHGMASFEESPPDVAEMTRRMKELIKDEFPYRVAEIDGIVKGYSYASRYRPRPAYRYTVENSVYVDHQCIGKGVGSALLEDLITLCTGLGFRQMMAVISELDIKASVNLHARFGFENVGVQRALGFKNGRWVDTLIMQRPLGEGDNTPP